MAAELYQDPPEYKICRLAKFISDILAYFQILVPNFAGGRGKINSWVLNFYFFSKLQGKTMPTILLGEMAVLFSTFFLGN